MNLAARGKRNRTKREPVVSLHAHLCRQKTRQQRARLVRRVVLTTIVLMAASASAAWSAMWTVQKLFLENPRYQLVHRDVEANGRLRRDQILAWAKIPDHCNLLALDLRTIRENLEKESAVASATVSRQMPNRLLIRVQERRPLARIVTRNPRRDYTIDREGVVMYPRAGEDFQHLPEITGLRAGDWIVGKKLEIPEVYGALYLLDVVELSPDKAALGLESIDVRFPDFLTVTTRSGATVRFSAESRSIGPELARFQQIAEFCEKRQQQIATADMTVARNVPVTLRLSVEETPTDGEVPEAAPSEG